MSKEQRRVDDEFRGMVLVFVKERKRVKNTSK